MYQAIKKNWEKTKPAVIFGFLLILLLLVAVVYKSDEKIKKKSETIENSVQNADLKKFKEFLLKQIKSPFINLNYIIQKVDTINTLKGLYQYKRVMDI